VCLHSNLCFSAQQLWPKFKIASSIRKSKIVSQEILVLNIQFNKANFKILFTYKCHLPTLLRKPNIKYRRNVKGLPGVPDFVLPALKTTIFVHGCFWHNHKNCKRAKLPETNRKFWKNKIDGNRRRDARVERLLRNQGWRVVTIWQCRLSKQEQVLRRLLNLKKKYD